MRKKHRGLTVLSWILQAAAGGRLGVGLAEVLAAALLVVPRTAALGGLLGLLLMVGAVGSHLTTLGIEVAGDGGALFAMALVTLVATAGVAILRRGRLPVIGPRLARGVPGA